MKKFFHAIGDYIRNTDWVLILLCAVASGLSVLLLFGIHLADMATVRAIKMQAFASGLGLAAAIVISRFDYRVLARLWKLYVPAAVGLIGLTYFFGEQRLETVDDKAWLPIPFLGVSFQPSELLKIAFILSFSLHLSLVKDEIGRIRQLLFLCLHGAVPVLLIHFQGDDGTALIFFFIFLFMIFAAGLPWRYLFAAIGSLAVLIPVAWLYLFTNDQKLRILSILVPEMADPLGQDYQQYNARVAIGSGGAFGKGLLGKTSVYVPEIHNDFIFSFVGEALGFVGCLAVILLLMAICIRLLFLSRRSQDNLGSFICIGLFAMIVSQSIVNIGMNLSLLPVIGVTLPFLSYGGTSVTTLYLGIGLALSVAMHNRQNLFTDG
ncbi:MAG: FtsW/RodA/SpoVE family cell cycle protein [Oscillospiraceae bacterium]|nr:FtsW/RodA/SpoVE family cell cycle protein [Oscillospiraceae bacterium]